jgi:hypothetical protein
MNQFRYTFRTDGQGSIWLILDGVLSGNPLQAISEGFELQILVLMSASDAVDGSSAGIVMRQKAVDVAEQRTLALG